MLFAAASLGLAGSLHCVAMCGPLVGLVAPVLGRRRLPALLYQIGRVSTYALIGALAGLAGAGADLTGLGAGLSVVAGVMMLLMAVRQTARAPAVGNAWWTRQLARALDVVAGLRATHPQASALGAGAINGALPCGLVYAAALVAAAAGRPLDGAGVMLAFGAGTIPALLGVWIAASSVPAAIRRRLAMLTPVALVVVGMLLVLRGVAGTAAQHVH
jgi:sulfite exporter TauE/SafE